LALVAIGACSSGSDRAAPAASSTTAGSGISQPTGTSRPPAPGRPVVFVPASIDSTGRADVTPSLQRFLASVPSGREIRFRKGGRYRIEGTLFLRGRHNITIDGNGATVFATTPGPPARSQWWVKGGSRIVFRNIRVEGANPEAGISEGAYRRKRETQHGFRLEGVNGVELDHVQVHDVFGDFVYLGLDKAFVASRNVWIHDSVFSRNGRQGIAVTAATNVIIERNNISQTRRSTIDLEPNSRRWHVSNVFVLNNTIGKGRLLFIASHGAGPVDNIVIKGNRLLDEALAIDELPPENLRRSNWVIENNVSNLSVHNRAMRFFRIDGLLVRGNHQQVTGGDPALILNDVCGAHVADNDFGPGGIKQTNTPCDAPLVVPVPPRLMGRGTTGNGEPVLTVPPRTTQPAPPATDTPSTVPSPSSSGGGFDLADGIFAALGVLVALAAVLAFRARRTRARP
jgi:hypothetical protein